MAKLDIEIPNLTLPEGSEMPMLGFGCGTAWYKTAGSTGTDDKLVESLKLAIKQGYTHLDGAEAYGTEPELGKAIKESGVAREKLFVTTKVLPNIDDIPAALDASLKKLGLDYVDLYLIHAPFKFTEEEHFHKAWADMEAVQASGKAKNIGVSSFRRPEMEIILKKAKVRPACNQLEFHPYLQRRELITYLKNQDIRISAFGPLVPITKAKGGPLDEKLEQLAKKYAVSPGEILLRWVIDNGVIAITTTGNEQRMSDYLRCCTFTLNPKEIEDISEIGAQHSHRQYWQDKYDKSDTA